MVQVPILLYHSVSEQADARFAEWTVSPQRFGEHMDLLAEQGYTALTVTKLRHALAQRAKLPPRPVVITFDDAFADFHSNALPHLMRTGLTATVFVPTGYIGGPALWLRELGEGDRKIMSWTELASSLAAGVELGAHSHTHPQLDTLPTRGLRREIESSRAVLKRLGATTSFAYPHGYNSARVRREVARAGFTCACAVADRIATSADDPYAMPRIVVRDSDDANDLADLLDSTPASERRFAGTVRRAAWRTARRTGAEALVNRARSAPG